MVAKLTKADLQCFCLYLYYLYLYYLEHLFKQRDVLHIGYFVEKKMKNHTVLIQTIKFNVKQVKQKPLEVCITWKVAGCLEFYIFPGYKNINLLLVIMFTINTFTQYYTVLSFLKRYFIENYLS